MLGCALGAAPFPCAHSQFLKKKSEKRKTKSCCCSVDKAPDLTFELTLESTRAPTVAQLVEHVTVDKRKSQGRWFDSDRSDIFGGNRPISGKAF